MKQAGQDLNLSTKKTREQVFLQEMDKVVPWSALEELIAPYYIQGRTGRSPFALQTILRLHFVQQRFNLSDQTMEEALFDVPLYREFAELDAHGRLPDERPSCGWTPPRSKGTCSAWPGICPVSPSPVPAFPWTHRAKRSVSDETLLPSVTRDANRREAIQRLSHDVLVQVASARTMSSFWMSEVPS
jgi:hypothetical protein